MTTATEPIRQPPPHLVAAQQKHSRDKRLRVQAVLQAMIDEGAIITFAEVARRAGVSRSLVYTRGIREDDRDRASTTRPSQQSPRSRTGTTLRSAAAEETQRQTARPRSPTFGVLYAKSSVQKSNSVTRPHCDAKSMNSSTITTPCRLRISELDTQLDAERTQRIELEDALSASRELVKKMIRDDNST